MTSGVKISAVGPIRGGDVRENSRMKSEYSREMSSSCDRVVDAHGPGPRQPREVRHDGALLPFFQGEDRLVHGQQGRSIQNAEGEHGALQLSLAHFLGPAAQDGTQLEDVHQLPDTVRRIVLAEAASLHLLRRVPMGSWVSNSMFW